MNYLDEVLLPDSGLGREIREYIERRLEIPERCVAFCLIFEVGKPVRIQCDYMPRPKVEA